MAFPAIAAGLAGLAKTAAGIGAGFAISKGLDVFYGPTLDVQRLAAQYRANRAHPILLPSPEQMTKNFYTGKMTAAALASGLACHGILWQWDKPYEQQIWRSQAWDNFLWSNSPQFNLNDYLHWCWQGRLGGDDGWKEFLRRKMLKEGLHRIDDQDLLLGSYLDLSLDTLLYLFQIRQITEEEFRAYLGRIGIRKPADQDWLRDKVFQVPTFEQWAAIANRQMLTDAQAEDLLQTVGYRNSEWLPTLKELRKQIPPYTDLISMAVHEGWDQAVIDKYQYDDEFPEQFRFWMAKQGYDWSEPVPNPAGGEWPAVNWPKMLWRAHWRTISAEQAFEMLHRFRPDPANPGQSIVPGVPPFEGPDVAAILKIHDYPKPFRAWLQALSYRIPRLVDIRWAREYEIKDRDWVKSRYQDRGHTEADADLLADIAEQRAVIKKDAPHKKRRDRASERRLEILRGRYRMGTLNRTEAKFALVVRGIKPDDADLLLDTSDDEQEWECQQQIFKRIKGDFLSGCIDATQADLRLEALAVKADRRAWHIACWQAQMTCRRKTLSTEQILDLVKRGLLTWTVAYARLLNLGWTQPDALLLEARTGQDILLASAKQVKAAQQSNLKYAKDLQQQIERYQAQVRQLQADLRRTTPMSLLKKLAKKGRISKSSFRRRLEISGYKDSEIDLHWSDCCIDDEGNEPEVTNGINLEELAGEENGKSTSENGGPAGDAGLLR